MSLNYAQTNTLYQSGSGSTIGATSVVLTSLKDIYGNVLTMADFGAKGYITLEPDTTNEEGATFTGITANSNGTYSLTGVSTILAVSPYTETSGLVREHAGGTSIVITDNVAFWNTFGNKQNNEILTGVWGTTNIPTNGTDFTNKTYVDGVAIAGAPDANSTTKGISKLSVNPTVSTNPIAVGDNDTRVPTIAQTASLVGNNTDIAVGSGNKMVTQTGLQHNAEKYATDAGSTDAYAITLSPVPTSYTNGMIVYFKANTINTGAATLNVNSLGAKTIVKGVSTTLADGDIAAGMLCTVIYDGTNFVLQNPVASTLGYKLIDTFAGGTYTATSNTILTNTIPANTLKVGSAIKINFNYTSTLGTFNAQSSSVGVSFGGASINSTSISVTADSTNSSKVWYVQEEITIINTSSTTQKIFSKVSWYNVYISNGGTQYVGTLTNPNPFYTNSTKATGTIDTTTNQDIVISYALSNSGYGNCVMGDILLEEYTN